MKKIIIFIFFLSSCSLTTGVRMILKERNSAVESPWYTLMYTKDNTIVKKHIRSEDIVEFLPQTHTTLIMLKPLGDLFPLTGYYDGSDARVELSYENSYIIELLFYINKEFPNIIKNLNMKNLLSIYKSTGLKGDFDKERFAYDLVHQRVKKETFMKIEPWWVPLGKLRAGLYKSDRPDIEDIFVAHDAEEVTIKLPPGVYNYFNETKKLKLSVFVNDLDQIAANEISKYVMVRTY